MAARAGAYCSESGGRRQANDVQLSGQCGNRRITFGGLLAFKGAAPNGNDGLLVTFTGGGNLARTT